MASHIGWVDFSSADREKVSQVLAMLHEPGTLDELGIGQIRDSYADLLFPGLSTIQTRAKYFITVPRIIRDYYLLKPHEQRKINLLAYIEQQENKLATRLVEKHKDSETGIIGSSLVGTGKGVARRPSSVYWNGLRQFGLVNTSLSLTEFCRRSMDQQSRQNEDDDQDSTNKSSVHLDSVIPNWMDDVSIHLSVSEAKFLHDKLTHREPLKHSVFSQLLILKYANEAITTSNFDNFSVMSRWLESKTGVDPMCRKRLRLAREFSEAMEGAHIRYNILIAQRANNADLEKKYESQFVTWSARASAENLFYLDCADAWLKGALGNVKAASQTFVRQWVDLIRDHAQPSELDLLVEKQAVANKGKRSLLKRNLGNSPAWQGMQQQSYRWPTALVILKDIMDAL